MGEPLICPKCKSSTMKWIDPDQDNLLEDGIMECCNCKFQCKGISEWVKGVNQYGTIRKSK